MDLLHDRLRRIRDTSEVQKLCVQDIAARVQDLERSASNYEMQAPPGTEVQPSSATEFLEVSLRQKHAEVDSLIEGNASMQQVLDDYQVTLDLIMQKYRQVLEKLETSDGRHKAMVAEIEAASSATAQTWRLENNRLRELMSQLLSPEVLSELDELT